MKARTKTTRWLLIALLFGILAATGIALTLHHGVPRLARVHDTAAPHPALNAPPPLPTSISAGVHTLTTPVGAAPEGGIVAYTGSNTAPADYTDGRSNPPAPPAAAPDAAGSNSSNSPSGGTTGVQQSNGPSTTSTPGTPPQNGAGDYANNGYAPLDCELPAGCGAPGSTGYVSRPLSGTSGGAPTHESSSPTPDGGTQTNNNGNSGPPSGNNDTGNSDPGAPGQDAGTPSVHSAPELDPATLAGALTLLLGALAVLRSRRVRATP